MRPKFVLLVFLVFVAMAAMVLLRPSRQAPQTTTAAPPVAVAPAAPANMPPPLPLPTPVAPAPPPPTAEQRQVAIDAERDQLYTWSMSGDAANLPKILADLNSPEKDIRLAAIEAAKQFGDTNAIPVLKAAAAKTDDSDEAMAMLQAADFIALPEAPLTAYNGPQTPLTPEQAQAQAQFKAQAAARRQAFEQMRAQHEAQMQGQQPSASPAPQPPGN